MTHHWLHEYYSILIQATQMVLTDILKYQSTMLALFD